MADPHDSAPPTDPAAAAGHEGPHGNPAGANIDLEGRVALVTGGTKGVGRGISQAFLGAGATVVVCGRNQPDDLPTAGDRTATFAACDVRDPEAVDALVDAVVAEHGHLDILVNNAGGAPAADTATASPRFTEKIIALNLLAPMWCAQAAYRVMRDRPGGGTIINIGSVSATRPSPGTAAYGAAKAGLHNLTTTLAVEWAPEVRVNAVMGGLIRTEMAHLHYGDDAGIARVGATVPLGRLADPAEIGNVCVWLASPLSSYVNGAIIAVHGGGERPAYLDAAT